MRFDDILIDRSFPEDNAPTRKPRTGMLTKYLDNLEYDLAGSFVIGDRPTDVELAKNLGCRAIYLQDSTDALKEKGLEEVCVLATTDWDRIAEFLFAGERKAEVRRTTKETDIYLSFDLDGRGDAKVDTGIGFFDHMLDGFARHGLFDLNVKVTGDLVVDCHHTIEDTGIVLGNAIKKAVGDKKGIKRFGSCMLPMDETLVLCAVDLSGRPYLSFDAEFTTDRVGYMDTEMVKEFFYAISYSTGMNLHLKVITGGNNHHMIEAMFKAFAKALDEATIIDPRITDILSTKGSL